MTKLKHGNIPAHTICPYDSRCSMGQDDGCKHLGLKHSIEYSCAAARGFDIGEEVFDEYDEAFKELAKR